jgi:D-serine deaminase-like pyridoxal phosphate-dependent protein
MTYAGETQLDMPRVEDVFKIGEKIELDVQHTCIAGAMFGWHFITDADGIVRDIYYPWKWW